MRALMIVVALAAAMGAAAAQSPQKACADTAPLIDSFLKATRNHQIGVMDVDLVFGVRDLSGEERAAFWAFHEKHKAAKQALAELIETAEDLEYALRLCAR